MELLFAGAGAQDYTERTMNTKFKICRYLLYLIAFALLVLAGCGSGEENHKTNTRICVVLAHPDDETIISGTLAMLASRGCRINVIYVTSGDDGPDRTGSGLHGEILAEAREQEAQTALHAIGIQNEPVFLRYPDSYVSDHMEEIQDELYDILYGDEPEIVITFGPDGITDAWDHKMTGLATDLAFDLTDSGRLLLHMAHTQSLIPLSENDVDVSSQAIDLAVTVSDYTEEKIQCFDAHQTQFTKSARVAYRVLVHARTTEEFIIARNRDASGLIQECFDLNHATVR